MIAMPAPVALDQAPLVVHRPPAARTITKPVAPTIIRPRKTHEYRQLSKKHAVLRFLIPVLALSLLGVGYWQISGTLQKNRATPARQSRTTANQATAATRSTSPSLPKAAAPSTPSPAPAPSAPAAPAKAAVLAQPHPAPLPPAVEPSPDPSSSLAPPRQSGLLASEIIEKFLAAPSLQDRLAYLRSAKSTDELATTFLARPWPIAQFTPGAQIPHPAEGLIEYYFEVRFGENSYGFPRLATFLLHQRGQDAPQVLVDPLLDTIGGRLQAFAAAPTAAPQDFYVIMDPRVKCFDYKIPNADKKCTFFLRSHIQGKDIVTAYANELSDVRQEFNDPLGGLRWKNPIPVVLTLQWNTAEDIARPFIEVIAIKAKSWNP
jgi:hypothetical protein